MAVQTAASGSPASSGVMDKGLKKGAIGYLSNIVIGVASTAPAYSLAATLGLILLSPLVEGRLEWIRSAPLRDAVATTIAAEIMVLPILLYETGNLSLVSLPANVLVSFLVPPAMLASAVAGAIALVIPFIAPVAGLPAYALLLVIVKLARGFAALPFAAVTLPAFPFPVVIAAYMGIAIGAKLLPKSEDFAGRGPHNI